MLKTVQKGPARSFTQATLTAYEKIADDRIKIKIKYPKQQKQQRQADVSSLGHHNYLILLRQKHSSVHT